MKRRSVCFRQENESNDARKDFLRKEGLNMRIKNGLVLTDEWRFECRDVTVSSGAIAGLSSSDETGDAETILDAEGMFVLPGLIDSHIHACAGHDFCDLEPDSLRKMSELLVRYGVTSFLPASMAYDEERLELIFREAGKLIRSGIQGGSQIRGIHMEGPFFSKSKKGAQSERFLINPEIDFFDRLNEASGGNIRIVDIAPELPGAMDFIRHASAAAVVSVAHTSADYDTAAEAFRCGASRVTHLFNAMPPFLHRSPGVIGAASDAGADVELICDGFHVHPSVIRSVFRWFGDEKILLISDAMMAMGLPDGGYSLGGQDVRVTGGKATLSDGTLAGSATDLLSCVRKAVSFGIPLASAVKAASYNPARSIGIDDLTGSISVGKRADLILLDSNSLDLVHVLIGGELCS
jgi:N-acetylglucosamine-6-phosphate deacetylase